jgi:hypothetical protein
VDKQWRMQQQSISDLLFTPIWSTKTLRKTIHGN